MIQSAVQDRQTKLYSEYYLYLYSIIGAVVAGKDVVFGGKLVSRVPRGLRFPGY